MKINTLGMMGVQPFAIEIEAAFARGIPQINIIGLASETSREIRDRVTTAIDALGHKPSGKRVTISLSSPHDVRLSRLPIEWLDLPLALLLLAEQNPHLAALLSDPDAWTLALGSTALNGTLRPLSSWAPVAQFFSPSHPESPVGWRNYPRRIRIIAPRCTSPLAARWAQEQLGTNSPFEPRFSLIEMESLHQAGDLLEWSSDHRARATGELHLSPEVDAEAQPQAHEEPTPSGEFRIPEGLDDPVTQVIALTARAKRLHCLFAGPPGIGKTHLAHAIAKSQGTPDPQEQILLALLHGEQACFRRPVRKPHHSATLQSLTGGQRLNIGELGLAHAGILFLDELAEFPASTLECLREPLDEKTVQLSRAQGNICYPADFQLLATMNPCPCGFFLSRSKRCRCLPSRVRSYLGKLTGPLLDRFHILAWLDRDSPDYHEAAVACRALLNTTAIFPKHSPPSFPCPYARHLEGDGTMTPGPEANSSLTVPDPSTRCRARTAELQESLSLAFPNSLPQDRERVVRYLRGFRNLLNDAQNLV